jgi:hypothetical protein
MKNIVDLSTGRARSRHPSDLPPDGARILLFTGVRYVREPEPDVPAFVPEMTCFHRADVNHRPDGTEATAASGACLDLAAH